jgi:hypothetical protein
MNSARVWQPHRQDVYNVEMKSDLFIETPGGESIRISIEKNGISILPINGVEMELITRNGSAGILFYTE